MRGFETGRQAKNKLIAGATLGGLALGLAAGCGDSPGGNPDHSVTTIALCAPSTVASKAAENLFGQEGYKPNYSLNVADDAVVWTIPGYNQDNPVAVEMVDAGGYVSEFDVLSQRLKTQLDDKTQHNYTTPDGLKWSIVNGNVKFTCPPATPTAAIPHQFYTTITTSPSISMQP